MITTAIDRMEKTNVVLANIEFWNSHNGVMRMYFDNISYIHDSKFTDICGIFSGK